MDLARDPHALGERRGARLLLARPLRLGEQQLGLLGAQDVLPAGQARDEPPRAAPRRSASSDRESWRSPRRAADSGRAGDDGARASGRRSAAAATASTEKSAAATSPPLSTRADQPPAAATIARAGSVTGSARARASTPATARRRRRGRQRTRRRADPAGGRPCPSALPTSDEQQEPHEAGVASLAPEIVEHRHGAGAHARHAADVRPAAARHRRPGGAAGGDTAAISTRIGPRADDTAPARSYAWTT